MPLPIGFYQNNHETHIVKEIWELLIEKNQGDDLVFQLHTFSENPTGYSESWCEGNIEIRYDFLFFKEKIGFHWAWKDQESQYHLVEIKDGFKATYSYQAQELCIGNVNLFILETFDLELIREKFADVKQQLNELLVMKNLYPTEFW